MPPPQQNEAFGGLFFSMGVAILVVYIVMVLALGSLVTPFIILFSLPLAIIGAIPALLITRQPARHQRHDRLPDAHRHRGDQRHRAARLRGAAARARRAHDEALVQGRPHPRAAHPDDRGRHDPRAARRWRSGFAHGSIIAAELATVVIGGLFTSTFLTLIVIPVIYSLVDGGKQGGAAALPAR